MKVKVGDSVIMWLGHSQPPKIQKVNKVTPTGQFRVDGFEGRFRSDISARAIATHCGTTVYAFSVSDEKFQSLLKTHETYKECQEVRKAYAANQLASAKAREAACVEATKELVGELTFWVNEVLSDGSRYYVIPFKSLSGAGVTVLTIRCKDIEIPDWGCPENPSRTVVKSSVSWCNTYEGMSFTTTSMSDHETDELAIWLAISLTN